MSETNAPRSITEPLEIPYFLRNQQIVNAELKQQLAELAAQNAVMREALKISDICLANAEMDESEDVRVQNAVALSLPQPAALREIEARVLEEAEKKKKKKKCREILAYSYHHRFA